MGIGIQVLATDKGIHSGLSWFCCSRETVRNEGGRHLLVFLEAHMFYGEGITNGCGRA